MQSAGEGDLLVKLANKIARVVVVLPGHIHFDGVEQAGSRKRLLKSVAQEQIGRVLKLLLESVMIKAGTQSMQIPDSYSTIARTSRSEISM